MCEEDVQKIWKAYSEYLCNVDTEKWVMVKIHGFNAVRWGNYF